VKVSSRKTNRSNQARQKTALRRAIDPLVPAILILGGAALLTAKSASAIELGQLQMNSTLGQPMNASIPYVLNPHEELYSYCISLTRSAETEVQSLTRAKITIVGDRIVITGSRPINEPMLAMRVAVNCPYTVRLARDFVVMINPAGTVDAFAPSQAPQPETRPVASNVAPAVSQPTPTGNSVSIPALASAPNQSALSQARVSDDSPVFIGDNYRVQIGDTLSKIANRIDGRTTGLWPAIDAIFQANPGAFVASDKNQLIAGSVLTIPDLQDYDATPEYVDAPALVAAPVQSPAPVESFEPETTTVATTSSSYEAYDSASNQWAEEAPVVDNAVDDYDPETSYTPASSSSYEVYDSNVAEPVEDEVAEPTTVVAEDTSFIDDTAVLTSGSTDAQVDADPVADSDFVAYGEQTLAETRVTGPVDDTESPVIEEATPKSVVVAKPLDTPVSESPSWLIWAGGGGAAVFILGLLFAFRQKIGGLFGGDDNVEMIEPQLDDDNAVTQKSHVLSDVDFPIDDIVEEDHEMQLDADLGDGIGLDETAKPEIEFAQTTELDMAIAATSEVSSTMELDADLGAGTGLQDGTDLDVAQDFGFSATGENAMPMDLELPVEVEVEDEDMPTDIIPPQRAESTIVVEDEVPPAESDSDTEYDLSMIVDATKQALGESDDLTAKNLNAVQLDAGQANIEDSAFTLSKEVDFQILEQDYEEELTQTQAVNEEIARAAVELAERMQSEDDVLDVTAEMPSRNKAPAENDSEATALNEALTVNEEVTVKVNMDDDDTVDSKNLG